MIGKGPARKGSKGEAGVPAHYHTNSVSVPSLTKSNQKLSIGYVDDFFRQHKLKVLSSEMDPAEIRLIR